MNDEAPPEVENLAERRADARRARDYAAADQLKAEIEAAGWKVADHGTDYRLSPARPRDVEVGGRVRYGASESVPSLLSEPPGSAVTVVLAAGDDPGAVDANLARLSTADVDVEVVVVADGPSPAVEERLEDWSASAEVVAILPRLSLGGAWNAGLRRAAGKVVVVVGRDNDLTADVETLAAALADPAVAVAGPIGLVSGDLRRWETSAGPDVDAVDAHAIAFRRSDAVVRGPLDERLATPRLLAAWWSLALRDEGRGEPARRAVVAGAGPAEADRVDEKPDEEQRSAPDRAERRDRYRLIDRFGTRYDLLRARVTPTAAGSRSRRR